MLLIECITVTGCMAEDQMDSISIQFNSIHEYSSKTCAQFTMYTCGDKQHVIYYGQCIRDNISINILFLATAHVLVVRVLAVSFRVVHSILLNTSVAYEQ